MPATDSAFKLQQAQRRLSEIREALFIFDNVELLTAIERWIPTPQRRCHVLLTSRTEQAGFMPVAMDLLSLEASLTLLALESGRDIGQDPDAHRICAILDGLPLALELTGAYLRKRGTCSLLEYADQLERKGATTRGLEQPGQEALSTTRHEASVARTLTLSESLFDDFPELERALDVLAWSASAAMGWPLLQAMVAPEDADALREGVDLAATLHILRPEPAPQGADTPRFRMHRLVQDVRRRQRPVEAQPELARLIGERLCAWCASKRQDFANLAAFEAEQDHLDLWRVYAEQRGDLAAVARMRWLQAYPWWHRGEYIRSRKVLEEAIATLKMAATQDELLSAHLDSDLGVILNHLGDHREALRTILKGHATRVKVLGEANSDTAMSHLNIGATYDSLGDSKRALSYGLRSIDTFMQTTGELSMGTAWALRGTGEAYRRLGDRERALTYVLRSLDIFNRLHSDEHPEVAITLEYLGMIYEDMANITKAMEHQKQAPSILTRAYGEVHPKISGPLFSISVSLTKTGNFTEALSGLQRALALGRRFLGEDHPATASTYIQTLICLQQLKDHGEGFKLAAQAVKRVSSKTTGYTQLIAAYNNFRPPGYHGLGPEGPHSGSSGRKKPKKSGKK